MAELEKIIRPPFLGKTIATPGLDLIGYISAQELDDRRLPLHWQNNRTAQKVAAELATLPAADQSAQG